MKIIQGIAGNASLLDEADHFRDADGGDADIIALGNRVIDKGGGPFAQAGIGEEIPDRGVGVGYGGDHQKSVRGKLANISCHFEQIMAEPATVMV
jgi:hypothetical protein